MGGGGGGREREMLYLVKVRHDRVIPYGPAVFLWSRVSRPVRRQQVDLPPGVEEFCCTSPFVWGSGGVESLFRVLCYDGIEMMLWLL